MEHTKPVLHHYGEEFNENSSNIILPYIKSFYNFNSVIDIGCGIGTWLNVAKNIIDGDFLGLDGNHVIESKQLQIPLKNFKVCDFESDLDRIDMDKKFDLAICIEVAEHLSMEKALDFVEFLTKCSDVIVFSAAIPGQTGENHKNEQFTEYWAALFKERNFVFFDPFRKEFWNDIRIEWWYRQNLFLVVNENKISNFSEIEVWDQNTYIIPEMLKMYTSFFNTVNARNFDNYIVKNEAKNFVNKALRKLNLK